MKKWISKSFKMCKKELLITSILLVFYTISIILVPISIRIIVNNISSNEINVWRIIISLLVIVGIYLVQVFINILWNISLDKLGGRFIEHLSNNLIYKLTHCDYRKVEEIGLNKVKSIMYSDVFDCFRIFGFFIPTMVSSFFVLFFCIGYSFSIELYATLFIIGSIIIGLLLTFLSRKRLNFVGKKTNMSMKEIYSNDTDICDNLIEIKTNSLCDNKIQMNSDKIRNFVKTAKMEDKRSFFWSGLLTCYNSIVSIGISFYVAYYSGENFLENLLLYMVLISLTLSSVDKVENALYRIFKLKNSIDNVSLVYDIDIYDGKEKVCGISSIKIQNLSYSFSNDQIVLKDLYLDIKKGEIIKLDGENGSGKSTLIKLILKVYQAPNNSILINGKDYNQLELDSYLNNFLYIGQDEKIQNMYLEDYFKLLLKDDFDSDLYKKCQEYLNFDVDKEIKENGLNLSVGQRKKVLLMKYLMLQENKSVVILDEVFAGLDIKTKEFITDYINESNKDKIVIIISHENDNIRYTNKIGLKDINR